MKRISLVLTVLACMSVAATATAAAGKVRPLPQAYAWMSKELSLTDEQQNGIADLNKPANLDKIAGELLKDQSDKVAELKKDLALALKEKNAAKIKETKAQLNAAEAELKTAKTKIRSKVMDKVEADMMALLTAEQKTKWAVHAALPQVQAALKPVTLTPDQVGKVRTSCEAQSAGLLSAWGSEKVEEWKSEIQSIVEDVKANVLSEAQQRQLPKEKAPKDGSGK